MKHLRKFNELFDTEELRDQSEIPFLKGEIQPIRWQPFEIDKEEDSEAFSHKLFFEYPILRHFHQKEMKMDDTDVICLYGTSFKDFEGEKYYCQLGLAYKDGLYTVVSITRKLKDIEDNSKWKVEQYEAEDIESLYSVVDDFLNDCVKYNAIREIDKFSDIRN